MIFQVIKNSLKEIKPYEAMQCVMKPLKITKNFAKNLCCQQSKFRKDTWKWLTL